MKGLILAGGKSSRMGEDKALLDINGLSFIEHTKRLLLSCACEDVLINHNTLTNCIPDIHTDKGPTSGIHAALSWLEKDMSTTPLLVSAVDTPFMPSSALQQLIEYGQTHKTSCYYGNLYLPVFIYDTENALNWLNTILPPKNAKGPSLRMLYNAIEAKKLDNSCGDWININQPSDYQVARRQAQN
ncbi:molybdenum cofactor guanylyltransferase [Agaribacter marinus]|uniref:Molybdenum cofactor guanylyltransferase n=1 Tax=Agaribacter marinus TaxID=1431249 RepID=A0AA37SUK7_9ALTE|nr:molybdenum cofactor guanylyltransferase [Agaribacter marinus]GLR69372.1 putative molybdenum cofactor guanylyltransferase [Agaribacter marinus]